MFGRLSLAILLAGLCFEAAAAPASDLLPTTVSTFTGVWYQSGTQNAYPGQSHVYSGPMATYSAWHRPMAIHNAERATTYFVFGNAENSPCISAYDHRTGRFAAPVILDTNPDLDAHRNPTLLIDADGFIYVFYGAHGHPTRVARSAEPWKIDAWRRDATIEDLRTSNPQPFQPTPAETVVSYRNSPPDSVDGTWCVRRSTDGAASWQPTETIIHFDGCSIYAMSIGASGPYPRKVHIAWSRLGGGVPEDAATLHLWARRYNVYYACSADGGKTWTRSDGTPYTLPIDEASAEKLYDSGRHGVWLKDIQVGPDGRPLVLFIDSETQTFDAKWKLARPGEAGWRISDVAVSDHMYDDGALVVAGADDYRFYGPTGVSQPHEDGGEIEEWRSGDEGATWKRARALTAGSKWSHNNVKTVFGGAPDFRIMWSYGDSTSPPADPKVDMFFFGDTIDKPRPVSAGEQ